MQQAIYNGINGIGAARTNKTTAGSRRGGLGRRAARAWDLYGVLALMASGAAYGALAVAGVGSLVWVLAARENRHKCL